MPSSARKTSSAKPSPLPRPAEAKRAPRNSRGMPLAPTVVAPPLPPARPRIDASGALPPGRGVGSFVLNELVGRDDFSLLYRATASASDAEVLIEEYWPAALVDRGAGDEPVLREPGLAALFDAGLAAFVDEAELLARIDDPALLKIGPVWRVHGTACRLRMEPVEPRPGRSLAERAPPADERGLRALIEPLLSALDAVHRAGRVHGNVRPGNVVLRDDESPLLLDFGAAPAAMARLAPWRAPQPEPAFAAPELQLYGVVPTPSADFYSLAALLWSCSTGELPDRPAAAPAAESRWAALRRRQPSLRFSAAWTKAIDAGLSFDAEARPQNAEAFRQLLIERPTLAAVVGPVVSVPPVARMSALGDDAWSDSSWSGLDINPSPTVSDPEPRIGPFFQAEAPDSPPPMRAVDDDDREPAWPVTSRPAMFDAPAEAPEAPGWPSRSRPAPPRPSRHWPWALGGALVGGAAMLVFGLGWDRLLVAPPLERLVQLAQSASNDVPLTPAEPTAAGGGARSEAGDTVVPPARETSSLSRSGPLPGERGAADAGGAGATGSSAVTPVDVGSPRDAAVRASAEPQRKTSAPRSTPVSEADPASACAPRSNFALYNCMKTQCERSAWYAHPQCIQLRREDER